MPDQQHHHHTDEYTFFVFVALKDTKLIQHQQHQPHLTLVHVVLNFIALNYPKWRQLQHYPISKKYSLSSFKSPKMDAKLTHNAYN